MKKLLALMLAVLMLVLCMAGCASKATTEQPAETETPAVEETPTPAEETTGTEEATGERPTIKFYGKCVEYESGPMMTDALEEKLADKYNIESIQIDWGNQEAVIRTGIASNDPCDVYNYPATQMSNFAQMAVDLKPYLDADPEFKSWFTEAELAACTIDGRIVCLPWEVQFPVMIGNKTLLDEIGVEIPDAWTMDEFKAACQKIQDAGYFPVGNATDLNRGTWFWRNGMLSITADEGKSDAYANGEIAYDGDESKLAMEAMKSLFDNNYMYPGEGAVTAKSDEIKAAYYQGKVLMITETAAQAATTASGAEFESVIIPWPSVTETAAILGGNNAMFIPQNCSDVDAAVEVLKTFLCPEIQAIHAEQGYIPANIKADVTNPFVLDIMKQTAFFKIEPARTATVTDYLYNGLLGDLILNGGVDTAAANFAAAANAG